MNDKKTPALDDAYALQTPEDSVRLYADWATTYDATFAQASEYRLPQLVAEAFVQAGGAGPVLDVGAGTGLLAEALRAMDIGPIDATDISPEMLEVAGRKGVYRDLIQGNILEQLPISAGRYGGIVSSGTFTNGHVGPEGLSELLRLAAPGALFALSINDVHFKAAGFGAAFKALGAQISDLTFVPVRIYAETSQADHKDDTGRIALFRKQ